MSEVPSTAAVSDDLPTIDHAARRDRLRAKLTDAGVEVALITDAANVRYLAGFTGSNGQVLVAAEPSGDRLVTDPRYEQRAALEAPGLAVTIARDVVGVALELVGRGRLGFEADHLRFSAGQRLVERAHDAGAGAVPTSGLVEGLRAVKDDAEVARLARACQLTVDGLAWLLAEVLAPGRSERELATALERRFVDLGADGVAFDSIVAAGPHGATPHHAPTDRTLQCGELVTIDCGAQVAGYHADCTRTVVAPGAGRGVAAGAGGSGELAEPELAEVHELVRVAQVAGRAAAVAGAAAGDVDAAAREVITAGGYGSRFVHGTGHGVGLEVHEAPAVAPDARAILEPGTALTVEPGVYLPGVGGVRIEDTIVVAGDGPARCLTSASRELFA